jgi:hypothetical protein
MLTGFVGWLTYQLIFDRSERSKFFREIREDVAETIGVFLWVISTLVFFWSILLPVLRDIQLPVGHKHIYLWQAAGLMALAGMPIGWLWNKLKK